MQSIFTDKKVRNVATVCKINATEWLKYAQKRFTLIETMVLVALLAILTGTAVPSFKNMMINRHLEGKASEYVTHMKWARSLAVSSNEAVNLHIAIGESASCYVVFQGPINDCRCNANGNGAVCTTAGNDLLVMVLPHFDGVSVSAQTGTATFRINPKQRTISPTLTAIFTADNGKVIHNISNILGRAHSCTPTEASSGFRIC